MTINQSLLIPNGNHLDVECIKFQFDIAIEKEIIYFLLRIFPSFMTVGPDLEF